MNQKQGTNSLSNAHRKCLSKRKYLHKKANATQESNQDYLDLISFSLLDEYFGIELLYLHEILKANGIVPVPRSPENVRGILNLRGNIITVLDLKAKLGLPYGEITIDSRVMIVQAGNRSIGLLVDKVLEIIRVEKKNIEPPSHGLKDEYKKYIHGITRHMKDLVIIPDLPKILGSI